MLIAIASTRTVKIEACRRAFTFIQKKFWPLETLTFQEQSVPSGVSEMPKSLEELMAGAKNRALNLIHLLPQADYSVGLEGGFFQKRLPQGTLSTFLQSWAYVTDGKIGYWGASYAAPVPPALAEAVYEKNQELGAIIDSFSGRKNVRDHEGAFGVLTQDILTRTNSFEKALFAAMAPFYNAVIYQKKL